MALGKTAKFQCSHSPAHKACSNWEADWQYRYYLSKPSTSDLVDENDIPNGCFTFNYTSQYKLAVTHHSPKPAPYRKWEWHA